MDDKLTYYNEAARICSKVYIELRELVKTRINNNEKVSILEIENIGNNKINEEVELIFKKSKDKGIALPVSISLNNCLGNYIYEVGDVIKKEDIVKIDLGVSINGCIANLGETFILTENERLEKSLEFLNKLQKDVVNFIKDGETADETRIMIESKSTEHGIFPVENCSSYQQSLGHYRTIDSKYMILNYKSRWDLDGTLISEENINYEFEEDDIYTINLTMYIDEDDNDNIRYKRKNNLHLYRLCDNHYQLKLKSSRNFYTEIKSKYNNYIFDIREYLLNPHHRIGIKECINNGILEGFPIMYAINGNNEPVQIISKKFTILVKKNKSYMLKYN